MKLTDEQVEKIVGYADGAYRVMAELEIDQDSLDELLLQENIERCPNIDCGWYDEASSMLNDESEPDGFCDNCRKYSAPVENEE